MSCLSVQAMDARLVNTGLLSVRTADGQPRSSPARSSMLGDLLSRNAVFQGKVYTFVTEIISDSQAFDAPGIG